MFVFLCKPFRNSDFISVIEPCLALNQTAFAVLSVELWVLIECINIGQKIQDRQEMSARLRMLRIASLLFPPTHLLCLRLNEMFFAFCVQSDFWDVCVSGVFILGKSVCLVWFVCDCICRSIDCCVCVRRYKGASGSSAVCAFTMDQVEEAFNGRYREVNRETQQWYTYNHPVPEPRPGAVSLCSLQKLLDGVPQNKSVMWMLGHSKKYIVIIYSPLNHFKFVWLCLFVEHKEDILKKLLLKSFHSHWNSLNMDKKHWKSIGNWKTLRFETNEN